MSTYTYQSIELSPAELSSRVLASSIQTPLEYVSTLADSVTITFDGELSAPDLATLDGLLVTAALASSKRNKFDEIDARTEELIATGYVFAGKVFSLSANAQKYWIGLVVGKDMMTYPLAVNTLDDSSTYDIQDAATVVGMYATAMGTVKARLGSGTALKDLVRAATTIAEVDAVVDPR